METPEPELLRYWRVAGVGAQPAAGDATTAAAGLQNARCPPRRTTHCTETRLKPSSNVQWFYRSHTM